MSETLAKSRTLQRAVLSSIAVFVLMAASPMVASDRELGKYHRVILFGERVIAEFTLIGTLDEASPYLEKYLYEDDLGHRLVISLEALEYGPHVIVVKCLATGERLTITKHDDNSSDIVLGAAPPIVIQAVDIVGRDALPQGVKDLGQQALGTLSNECRQTLSAFADVSNLHTQQFEFVGAFLGGLFFTQHEGRLPRFERGGAVTGAVKDFDPLVHPPGEFELAFGHEYFSLP